MAYNDYDLLIIGGGMVGASLACALAGLDLHIGLVEAELFTANNTHPSYDDRTVALAQGTKRIFQTLGLWEMLESTSTPIQKIHISERGCPGLAHIDCCDEGVDALGYVVEARLIGAALLGKLLSSRGVEVLCPAYLEKIPIEENSARAIISFNDNRIVELRARLIVAADGACSRVRKQLGITALRWEYEQQAVIANVTSTIPHCNTAYERFTEEGPVAFLPMSGHRCAVVYTVNNKELPQVLSLDDSGFSTLLSGRFGDRLGAFSRIGQRQAYPLFLLKALEHTHRRIAIIGNAAHTLHPIAGQGLNLSIRDIAALAEVIADAWRNNQDIGGTEVLEYYAEWRRWDQIKTIACTDILTRLFVNPLPPVHIARTLGLLAFDFFPPIKSLIARQFMGLDGRLTKLARGIPLTD